MTEGFEERRRFIRHPASLPLVYIILPGGEATLRSSIRDIGLGGISFFNSEAIDRGAVLEMSVPALETGHKIIAQVAWCTAAGDGYDIGASFSDEENAFKARMVEQVCQIELYRRELERKEGRPVDAERAGREWIAQHAKDFPR